MSLFSLRRGGATEGEAETDAGASPKSAVWAWTGRLSGLGRAPRETPTDDATLSVADLKKRLETQGSEADAIAPFMEIPPIEDAFDAAELLTDAPELNEVEADAEVEVETFEADWTEADWTEAESGASVEAETPATDSDAEIAVDAPAQTSAPDSVSPDPMEPLSAGSAAGAADRLPADPPEFSAALAIDRDGLEGLEAALAPLVEAPELPQARALGGCARDLFAGRVRIKALTSRGAAERSEGATTDGMASYLLEIAGRRFRLFGVDAPLTPADEARPVGFDGYDPAAALAGRAAHLVLATVDASGDVEERRAQAALLSLLGVVAAQQFGSPALFWTNAAQFVETDAAQALVEEALEAGQAPIDLWVSIDGDAEGAASATRGFAPFLGGELGIATCEPEAQAAVLQIGFAAVGGDIALEDGARFTVGEDGATFAVRVSRDPAEAPRFRLERAA